MTKRIDDQAVLDQIRKERRECERHIERHRSMPASFSAAAERRLVELDRLEYGEVDDVITTAAPDGMFK